MIGFTCNKLAFVHIAIFHTFWKLFVRILRNMPAHTSTTLQKKKLMQGSEQHRAVVEKKKPKQTRKYTKKDNSPFHSKNKVWTNVSHQQWPMAAKHGLSTIDKQTENCSKSNWDEMLGLKPQNKITYSEIRKRTKITDIIEYTLKQMWRWARHIARTKDNRWTKRCTEWQPKRGKRSKGRQTEDGKMT